MRIGIDASNLRLGGGITHLVELLRVARPNDHGISEIIVWGGAKVLRCLPRRNWLRTDHQPLLDMRTPFRLSWQAFRLPKLARDSCDILFVPGGSVPHDFRPCVTMCRNLLPFDNAEISRYGFSPFGIKLWLLRSAQASSFRKVDGLIYLTHFAQRVVEEGLGGRPNRSVVIPHGVSQRFKKPPRTAKAMGSYSDANPFRWLYVSVIDSYKHQWKVIEGMSNLRQNGFSMHLSLIGEVFPRAAKALYNALSTADPEGDWVELCGQVPHHDLPYYYHAADGFVYASSCENMPNILLEAMASGLPIACSNRGPMPEILGDGGSYFDPESPREIADVCSELMEDYPLRQKKAEIAYERAQSHTWERCAEKTFSFLEEVTRESMRAIK